MYSGIELSSVLSPGDIPLCTTLEQLLQHDDIDMDIWLKYEQKIIINKTGCNVPCTFKAIIVTSQ